MNGPISQEDLNRLMAAVSHEYEDCDIGLGQPIPMRRVTVLETLGIARQHKSFADALGKDEISYLGLVLDAGPDAIASFVAASAGKKGKEAEAFKRSFMEWTDEVTLALGFHAWRLTVGDEGIDGFFTRVRTIGERTGAIKPQAVAA